MDRPGTPGVSPRTDRIMPHSEEAERGVLGSCLLDPRRVIDYCIEQRLMPESFYLPSHQTLFDVLVDMTRSQKGIDILTVADQLRDRGVLDGIGGPNYLDHLVDQTPLAAHAEHYVDIVRQKHVLRMIIERASESIDACYRSEEEAEALLSRAEQAMFEIGEHQSVSLSSWDLLVDSAVQEINEIIDQKRAPSGIHTGYDNLDRVLTAMQPQDMLILAARPSMGKTALALNIAERVALGRGGDRQPHGVAVFSLEMSAEALVRRMLCSRARVSSQKLRIGKFLSTADHQNLLNAADALRKAPIYIDDSAGLSAMELRSRARRLKRQYAHIGLIVVDYLQMMNYPQRAREGRQQEVAAISNTMKAMAKELRVPVLMLSQLSRAPESRSNLGKPKLSDLRDSGSIEQDADVVMLLRRPCKYPEDDAADDKRLAVVDVAKHRNGPTGEVKLNFEEEFTRFEDRMDAGVDPGPEVDDSSGGYG
jgi:replicative DNA helicase